MRRFLPVLAAAVGLTGCAYTGNPLPPLANIPGHITDLAVVQRGGHIVAQFTPPPMTTEGMAIKQPLTFDLRIGAAQPPFDSNQWAAAATQVPSATPSNGTVRYEIPSAPWAGKEVVVAVRAIGANRKASEWSNYLALPVVPAPATPADLKAESAPSGVRVSWSGTEASFRVLCKLPDGKAFDAVATVNGHEWLDDTAQFGKPYSYMVQGLVALGNDKTAESEPAGPVAITPVDTFPPAVPVGLQGTSAPNSIELTWERNTEPDLAAYRVYRAEAGGEFAPLGDTSLVPSYSDRTAAHGKTYRYAVSALDRAGNQSPRSEPVEVALP